MKKYDLVPHKGTNTAFRLHHGHQLRGFFLIAGPPAFSVCFSSAALARVLNGGMAPTLEIARVEKQAFSALKQFIPDELREQLPKYFS